MLIHTCKEMEKQGIQDIEQSMKSANIEDEEKENITHNEVDDETYDEDRK